MLTKYFSKQELKTWLIYFTTVLIAVYVHEIGHCLPAWVHGYKVIPTPAKEYPIDTIPAHLQPYISLGGIAGSVLFAAIVFIFYLLKTKKYSSAILAGSVASPGLYTYRFLMMGRGHDETEFQESQAALGFSYDGHSVDWIFLFLVITGIFIWIIKAKPTIAVTGRLLLGIILTFLFLVILQKANNTIFDPIFYK